MSSLLESPSDALLLSLQSEASLLNMLLRKPSGELYQVGALCKVGVEEVPGVVLLPLDVQENRAHWALSFEDLQAQSSAGKGLRLIRRAGKAALRHYLPDSLLSEESLQFILDRYREPHRFFHTEWHLYDLFDKALNRGLKLSLAQSMGLLFHDIVYSPGAPAGENESKSVALMLALLRQDLVPDVCDWGVVCKIIFDTALHTPSTEESAVVQSLDLSSLADPFEKFEVTNEQIWLEFRHLFQGSTPRTYFNKKRGEFLLNLRKNKPVFAKGFEDYEQQLDKNTTAFAVANSLPA